MKLYEIADQIEKVLASKTDFETGEIAPEAVAELDALDMALRDKAVQVALYMKGEEAEAEAVDREVKKLTYRRDVHRRRAEWLKTYLGNVLGQGSEPIKDPRVTIGWRASYRVEVVNELDVPMEFKRTKVEIDKASISAQFRAGNEVPGCVFAKHQNLQVK